MAPVQERKEKKEGRKKGYKELLKAPLCDACNFRWVLPAWAHLVLQTRQAVATLPG